MQLFRGVASGVDYAVNCTVTRDVASESLVVCREAVSVDVSDEADIQLTRRASIADHGNDFTSLAAGESKNLASNYVRGLAVK